MATRKEPNALEVPGYCCSPLCKVSICFAIPSGLTGGGVVNLVLGRTSYHRDINLAWEESLLRWVLLEKEHKPRASVINACTPVGLGFALQTDFC